MLCYKKERPVTTRTMGLMNKYFTCAYCWMIPWMIPECSLNICLKVPWMIPECSLNIRMKVPWMFPECSLIVRYPRAT
jgi:hypothetical protein